MNSPILKKYRSTNIQVRAAFWFLVCAFLQKGISCLTIPIFTRLLSTEQYGQFNVFNAWLGIVSMIVTLNLSSGVYLQGLVKFSDEKRQYTSAMQGINIVLVAIWTLVYLLFKDYWNRLLSLTTVQMLAMIAMIWATATFQFWAVEQRVEYKYQKLVLITLLVSIAKPVVGIIFVINSEDKVTARILGLVLVELVFYSGLGIVQMIRGRKLYIGKYWKYAILFNLPLLPHYLSNIVLSSSDRIMIDNLVGTSEAGIYSLAYSISQIMLMFNTALTQTMDPWLYNKIKEKKISDISPVAYPAMIGISIVNIFLIALAPEVVMIFAPPAYTEAIGIIPPVTMSVFFLFIYHFFAAFEFYYEKTSFIMISTTGAAILNILLNVIFIRKFGYYAAAYTTLICYLIYAILHYIFMRRICKTELENKQPYSTKTLGFIAVVFMCTGFLFLAVYKWARIRYLLLLLLVIILWLNKEKIKDRTSAIIATKKRQSKEA